MQHVRHELLFILLYMILAGVKITNNKKIFKTLCKTKENKVYFSLIQGFLPFLKNQKVTKTN